jgi:uncharacterized protein
MDSERLDEVARRHGIRLVLQFGSTITGKQHAGSDLDLAVLLSGMPSTCEAQAALFGDLQELFPGSDVDVAILNRADPLFLKQIMQRCELVYGDLRDLHELKMYAFKRYQDHRRYLALERKYVERAVEALSR